MGTITGSPLTASLSLVQLEKANEHLRARIDVLERRILVLKKKRDKWKKKYNQLKELKNRGCKCSNHMPGRFSYDRIHNLSAVDLLKELDTDRCNPILGVEAIDRGLLSRIELAEKMGAP